MTVNTLFPSASQAGKNKGGVILLQLQKTGDESFDANKIHLNVSYQDTTGEFHHNQKTITFNETTTFHENQGIRKSILLAEYVTVLKDWMLDARASCHDEVAYPHRTAHYINEYSLSHSRERSQRYAQIKAWERSSCRLYVSEGYEKILSLFKRHYEKEMKALNDDSLEEEQEILVSLLMDNKAVQKNPVNIPVKPLLKPHSNRLSGYKTQYIRTQRGLPYGKDSLRFQAKSKNGIVTVKMLFKHPNTSLKQVKETGKEFNYIEHITVKINQHTVCNAYTSQNLSKNPYFSCQFKNYGVKNGDKLVLEYSDLKGRYTSTKILENIE